jgi:hypothetical protein
MQKCAVLPGKMQKSGAELGKTNVHVEVVRNIKIAVVKTHKINTFRDLINLHKYENNPNCLHFVCKLFS